MKRLFLYAALAAAVTAAPAFAEELVARQGNDSVRLTETPCKSELVLSRLQQGMREEFRSASATVDGKSYQACWRLMGNAALLLYEDGDQGLVPMAELKPEMRA